MDNPIDLLPKSAFVNKNNEFKPKLSVEDRCAVLAFVNNGVQRAIVAKAFGIDRRTVGHICNLSSPKYHDVHKRYKSLGPEAFNRTYLSEAWAKKIAVVAEEDVIHKEDVQLANRRLSAKAGLHTVHPEQCAHPHRIEIAFLERQGSGAVGWHYRDLDSRNPEEWLHNGFESLKSSRACYDMLMENLIDD